MITTNFKMGDFEAELTEVRKLTEQEMLANDLYLPIRTVYTVIKGDSYRKAGETFSNGHSEEEARELAKDLMDVFDMVGEFSIEEIENIVEMATIEEILDYINKSL